MTAETQAPFALSYPSMSTYSVLGATIPRVLAPSIASAASACPCARAVDTSYDIRWVYREQGACSPT